MDPKQKTFVAHIKARSYDKEKLVKYYNKFKHRLDINQEDLIERCLLNDKSEFAEFLDDLRETKFYLKNTIEMRNFVHKVLSRGFQPSLDLLNKRIGEFYVDEHAEYLFTVKTLEGVQWVYNNLKDLSDFDKKAYNGFLTAYSFRRIKIVEFLIKKSIEIGKPIDVSRNDWECVLSFKVYPKNRVKAFLDLVAECSEALGKYFVMTDERQKKLDELVQSLSRKRSGEV